MAKSKCSFPAFVDHHPAYTASGYLNTNEEPDLFKRLLPKGTKVEKALCVASGGEVLLSVVLPVAKQIVAVDHSYNALAASYSKLILLQQMPEVKQLLDDRDFPTIQAKINELWKQAPSAIRDKYPNVEALSSTYVLGNMRRELNFITFPKISNRRINKISFLHGDITDAAMLYGAFDLFYASNVMEHSSRTQRSPTFTDMSKLLNPGGLLLFTGAGKQKLPDNFQLLHCVYGYRTSWYYTVARKVGEQNEAA
jgi:hypothetical protein